MSRSRSVVAGSCGCGRSKPGVGPCVEGRGRGLAAAGVAGGVCAGDRGAGGVVAGGCRPALRVAGRCAVGSSCCFLPVTPVPGAGFTPSPALPQSGSSGAVDPSPQVPPIRPSAPSFPRCLQPTLNEPCRPAAVTAPNERVTGAEPSPAPCGWDQFRSELFRSYWADVGPWSGESTVRVRFVPLIASHRRLGPFGAVARGSLPVRGRSMGRSPGAPLCLLQGSPAVPGWGRRCRR